jgi:site-specific DNA-methyltransferase (adenine-specific)
MHRIISGDILRFAAHYRGPKFHAVLCDPPYELGFMGKSWDSRGISFRSETWAAIGSLLAPGAHLLAFGGTRTFHRIAVAIEDAGFEIRDTLGWLYGSGFPKSHDVSKAIDREAGAERERIGDYGQDFRAKGSGLQGWQREAHSVDKGITAPATDAARAWQGYGTALKPAWEPVIVARNPLVDTVAQNALEHGTGALNIDGARVSWANKADAAAAAIGFANSREGFGRGSRGGRNTYHPLELLGRWPANIIHDGSEEVLELFPETNPARKNKISDNRSVPFVQAGGEKSGGNSGRHDPRNTHDDNGGSAARFFYCAKAGKREREEGLDGFDGRPPAFGNESGDGLGHGISNTRQDIPRRNHHPTVKPIALTQYLATLILPPPHVESRILVPFAGSGSECIGAALAGWRTVVGVEREAEYVRIAQARLEYHTSQNTIRG